MSVPTGSDLEPGWFTDSDAPAVRAFAERVTVGRGDPVERAVALFDLGCAGHDPYACVTLGDILAGGRGVPQDVPRALRALDHACWLGDPEACDMADGLR